MAFEQRDNSGALFKNDRKEAGSNHADYNGTVMIDGQEYWINAWVKESSRGKFFSLSFKPKEEAKNRKPSSSSSSDEVPF